MLSLIITREKFQALLKFQADTRYQALYESTVYAYENMVSTGTRFT